MVLAVILTGYGLMASAIDLTIAKRGSESDYVVVISKNARPAEKYAAEEFRDYVKRLTAVELKIVDDAQPVPAKVVFIGESRHVSTAFGANGKGDPDGFEIATKGTQLAVRGHSPRGTLYGVYELLERFGGCSWFASFFEDIPCLDSFAVPEGFSDRQDPAFELREALWYDAYQPKTPEVRDFAARLRLNGAYHEPQERHGGNTWQFSTNLWNGHTYYWLADPEKYFDTHPEWFSMVNGKRLKEKTQLCLTNQELLQHAISNTLRAVELEPQAKVFCISHMDWRNWCECPKCKAIDDEEGSHMATKLRFVNDVAEVMERVHPDKIVHTEAYTYTQKPPKFTRPRKNVQIAICPLDSDFSLPQDDPSVARHRRFMDNLNGWLKLDAQFYIWHYASNFGKYPAPYQNKTALPKDLKMFADKGIRRMFVQGAYQGHHAGFAELDLWIVSKLLWNPRQPLEPLYDRFCRGYYGAAAPVVRKSIQMLEELKRDHAKNPLTAFEWLDPSLYTADFVEAQQVLWRKAAELVKGDSRREYSVRMSAFAFDYLRYVRDLPHARAIRQLDFRPVQDSDGAVRRFRELSQSMVARWDEAGDMRFCENKAKNAAYQRRLYEASAFVTKLIRDGRAIAAGDVFRFKEEDERCEIIENEKAMGQKMLRMKAGFNEWPARLLSEDIGYVPGMKFDVRLRIKAERTTTPPSGKFNIGIYDEGRKGTVRGGSVDVATMSDDWTKVRLGEWEIRPGQYIYLNNPSTVPILVGAVGLRRTDEPAK